MLLIEEQYSTFRDEGVKVISVNIGEPESAVANYLEEHNITFTTVIDHDRDIFTHFGVVAVPTTVLIDKHGVVQDVIPGATSESQLINNMERIRP